MSIFDAGFILWGFIVLYLVLVVAYLIWARVMNRRDVRVSAPRRTHDDGGRGRS